MVEQRKRQELVEQMREVALRLQLLPETVGLGDLIAEWADLTSRWFDDLKDCAEHERLNDDKDDEACEAEVWHDGEQQAAADEARAAAEAIELERLHCIRRTVAHAVSAAKGFFPW